MVDYISKKRMAMNTSECSLKKERKVNWSFAIIVAFIITTAGACPGMAQVKTEVPPVVPGANSES